MLLPSYLWRFWGEELRERGYSWQDFLNRLKLHTREVVLWALEDKLTWQELIRRISPSLTGQKEVDLLSYLAGGEGPSDKSKE